MAGLKGVAIGLDQLCNSLIGGEPDETLSARSWRLRNKSPAWNRAQRVIDALFFFDADHCMTSYQSEMDRKQLPTEYQKKGQP